MGFSVRSVLQSCSHVLVVSMRSATVVRPLIVDRDVVDHRIVQYNMPAGQLRDIKISECFALY